MSTLLFGWTAQCTSGINYLSFKQYSNYVGQLTGKGFLQLISLGEYIMTMYGKRLGVNTASFEENEIAIFATPIERTQQSAAAFVAGMLGPSLTTKITGTLYIFTIS